MPCRVVTCQSAIGDLLAEVREEQQLLSRPPHLVAFLANSDPGAKQYAEWTEKTFKEQSAYIAPPPTPTVPEGDDETD